MWESLRKMHDAFDQRRLNFLNRRFFNYKVSSTETIDEICSNLAGLQTIMQNIKKKEPPTDLNVALTLINAINDDAYTLAKYHFEEMNNLTLEHRTYQGEAENDGATKQGRSDRQRDGQQS